MVNEYANDIATGTAQRGGQSSKIIGEPSDHEGPGPEVMAASTLEGDAVLNRQDEDLGTIKEIMIDVLGGRVAYAVLESGGLLGMGSKLFAIPWEALTLDTPRKCFILDMDKETLKNAPGFDKDHWPSMADATWANKVRSFYDVDDRR